jgi:hypothetical protein
MATFSVTLAVRSLATLGAAWVLAGTAMAVPAQISIGPLTGPDNAETEIPVLLHQVGAVVGLQIDLEPVAGRFEPLSFTAGSASSKLQVRSSLLTNGQTRVVVFSTTNRRLGEGEVLKIRGMRRNQAAAREAGLSMRAVTLANDRGLVREFAFAPYVKLEPRGGQPTPGQPVVFDAVVFPAGQSTGVIEVRVNGQLVAQSLDGQFSVTWTPLEPGLAFITALSRGGTGAAAPLSLPVAGNLLDTYAKWRAFHFPTDPTSTDGPGRLLGDADQDSILNLWEYARGSAPRSAADGQSEVEKILVRSGTEDFIGLRVRVRAAATDFEAVGEASGSLAFSPTDVSPALVVSREPAGEFEIITLRDTVPVSAGRQRFLRARLQPRSP